MKLILVLRNGFDILIPVLIWGGHTQILDNMDKFPKQVALCPELPRGGNLDNEHGQSVDTHDDQEHLERLSKSEEGVEGVGGCSGHTGVVPPVQLPPINGLVKSTQLNCIFGILP